MVNLDIYSGKQKQNILGMLIKFDRDGVVSIKDVISSIETDIQEVAKQSKEVDYSHSETVERIDCPSCKNGRLLPIPNNEGLTIIGCKKCRYSRIVKD